MKELRDIGIIYQAVTPRSSKDSVLQQGSSIYLLWQEPQLKAALDRYGVDKDDLQEALSKGGHHMRIVGDNRMELVYTFIFPPDPLKKAIPQ